MENSNGDVLTIERIFDAPRELVWKMWTDPELIKKWWGPKYFTAPQVMIDFKVGGKYLYCMHGSPAEGMPAQDFWSTGTYKEIIPMEKIVCTDSFSDEKGNIISAETFGMKGFPLEMQVSFTFEDAEDGKTKLILQHSGISNLDALNRSNMEQGWEQSLDKMEGAL